MLSFLFSDIILGLVNSLLLVNLWTSYYICANNITTPAVLSRDTKIKKTPQVLENLNPVLRTLFLIWSGVWNYIYIQNITTQHACNNTFYMSNNTMIYFYCNTLILIGLLSTACLLKKQNSTLSVEYLILIFLAFINGYYLISSTSMYSTLFLLELAALMVFGKFTATRVLSKHNRIGPNNTGRTFLNQFSFGLINALFFQFWANFVSSVFLFFALLNFHYSFGTSNFFMLDFLFSIVLLNRYLTSSFVLLIMLLFTTGLFIKLGLSPYQFFKVETYKGFPFVAVVAYTTVYLATYFYFFIYLHIYQLNSLRSISGNFCIVALICSTLYLFSLLFDTKNFKAFLSYSTLIIVINVLIVMFIV